MYERLPSHLREARHIADYRTERIAVALTDEERVNYERAAAVYRAFLRKHHIYMRSGSDYERHLIFAAATTPLLARPSSPTRRRARIALSASGKLDVVANLLARHRDDRVLIFSEYNYAGRHGRQPLLPAHRHAQDATRRAQSHPRRLPLSGRFTKLATGRVLNEGVDLPDANVAIILSGSATKREFIQRLGRVLRPKQTEAVLYEVVTDDTTEESISQEAQGVRCSE